MRGDDGQSAPLEVGRQNLTKHILSARVGFPHSDGRLARQMSAGQQRRVALARVLLLECALWLLDEPTSNLDTRGQDMFGQILSAHLERGGLAVIATHQALAVPAGRVQGLELS